MMVRFVKLRDKIAHIRFITAVRARLGVAGR